MAKTTEDRDETTHEIDFDNLTFSESFESCTHCGAPLGEDITHDEYTCIDNPDRGYGVPGSDWVEPYA